ncbi:NUDIX hydrolase [Ornithinimicrobium ciconiae]|uniref:NUDIX hydrolase n=1 Tax=Ornithinimicrobium ciconiae TaxID=2594265 RepID=A0A516GEY5_9MICO|nr:NUDIX hydrolase [Ornithinimicrobium ciconiae]
MGVVTLHRDALRVLTAWVPPTGEQAALRDRFGGHLYDCPDGMQRSCYPDHITASTVVLSDDGHRVLLTLHARARRWFQFGGHCEPEDQRLVDAALREAAEESGIAGLRIDPVPIHLDEHEVPFCGDRPGVHHLDVRFVAVAPPGVEHAVSEESLDVRWWPVISLGRPNGPPDLAGELLDAVQAARARLG